MRSIPDGPKSSSPPGRFALRPLGGNTAPIRFRTIKDLKAWASQNGARVVVRSGATYVLSKALIFEVVVEDPR